MDARSLTQVEAERRAALLAVERYDVAVDLTELPTGPRVRCVSTVTFRCREPGAETFVDCAAEVVTATVNGAALGPAADGRIPLAGLAERNVLRIESVQADTTEGAGVHKAVDPANGEVYVWMSFEPDEARHAWACFDQPDLKAPHAITVTAPAEWTVTSNSGHSRIETLGAARRWTFPPTPPLSTYNVVVNAGRFHRIRRQIAGHDMSVYSRLALASLLNRDADEIFTLTEQGLAFFADVFGMPFPQRSYDQVFMPEFGGAMENFGCVTYSDVLLRRATPTPAEREIFAKYLLHEMAHMWFGNLVTMRWWDDLWLNEAFAEFACHWAAVRSTRYTDAWAVHLADWKLTAYLADQGPASHPIRQPLRDVAEAASVFDAITYPKGASVLKQLMTFVGEDAFIAGMTAYFARYAWGNTTLQDLIDALAAASGCDLDAWRRGWLETAGTDRLTLERDDAGDGLVLRARGPDGSPRPHVLAVGAYRRGPDGWQRTARAEVDVRGPRTPVNLPPGADLYLVNDDDLTFATTRTRTAATPATGTDDLLTAAAGLPTALSRGVAVATVWDMLVTGEVPAADVVRCLTGVLAAETADAVVEPYLALVCDVAELWSSDAERPELTAMVAATCRAVADDPGRRRVALRGLARTARDLDEVAWLQAQAGDTGSGDTQAGDTGSGDTQGGDSQAGDTVDLRWRALIRAAELGGDTAAEVVRLRDTDPDPDAWVRALAVRVAVPDAAGKAEAWQAVADRKVPIGSVASVATAFWRPGQDDLLAPFVERYLELVPDLHRGGMIPAMVITEKLFPLFGFGLGGSGGSGGTAFLERATAASEHAAPVVRKTMLQRADLVRRMLQSRG